jgi:hypothetical protein
VPFVDRRVRQPQRVWLGSGRTLSRHLCLRKVSRINNRQCAAVMLHRSMVCPASGRDGS